MSHEDRMLVAGPAQREDMSALQQVASLHALIAQ